MRAPNLTLSRTASTPSKTLRDNYIEEHQRFFFFFWQRMSDYGRFTGGTPPDPLGRLRRVSGKGTSVKSFAILMKKKTRSSVVSALLGI
jgi:hypothetical protein